MSSTLNVEQRATSFAGHIRPARLEDIDPILTLQREAFADKFGGAFGQENIDKGVIALAASWRRQGPTSMRGMLVAEAHDTIVGTTTLRTSAMGNDDGAAAELAFQQALGAWGAARSLFALSILDHRIGRDEGFITDVAVLAPWRRQGVARDLLARAEEEARLKRKRYLGLYVSAANQQARPLYASLGYRDIRTRHSWAARFIFGQRSWVYMCKDLV